MADAYPLDWPTGWPRSRSRTRSRYSVSFAAARDDLLESLRIMGATSIVISTNVELRRDGLPYAREAGKRHEDPGVAVYFYRAQESHVLACDVWETVRDNLRAIGLTINGLRAIERAGASELMDRAFTGFKALPPAFDYMTWDDAMFILELDDRELVTAIDISDSYKRIAKRLHPDVGGANDAMARLNAARDFALREVSSA